MQNFKIDVNVSKIILKCEIISKHLTALAEELKKIDNSDKGKEA